MTELTDAIVYTAPELNALTGDALLRQIVCWLSRHFPTAAAAHDAALAVNEINALWETTAAGFEAMGLPEKAAEARSNKVVPQ